MSEQLVHTTDERGVFRLVMNAGANALNVELIDALRAEVARLRTAGGPPFELRSRDSRLFSPGWDLKRLVHAVRDEVSDFLSLFNALILEVFSYPGPTVATVQGHAIAGGCLLALACDYRVMALGRPRLGLSEVNLGVPVPAECVRMLRARLDPGVVEELVFGCDGFTAQRAQEFGLVQGVVPPERVESLVEQELRTLVARPRAAYVGSKRFMYEAAWAEMERQRGDDAATFLDCWFSDETQERIQALVKSFGT
jgi:enoyl-CoA hydratase